MLIRHVMRRNNRRWAIDIKLARNGSMRATRQSSVGVARCRPHAWPLRLQLVNGDRTPELKGLAAELQCIWLEMTTAKKSIDWPLALRQTEHLSRCVFMSFVDETASCKATKILTRVRPPLAQDAASARRNSDYSVLRSPNGAETKSSDGCEGSTQLKIVIRSEISGDAQSLGRALFPGALDHRALLRQLHWSLRAEVGLKRIP